MQMKILFADDQIPDENLADDDVEAALKRKYPKAQQAFLNSFPIMRQAVATLRNAGYDVTVATGAKDALSLAAGKHFDIAIVDMGWFGDLDVPEGQREYFGWKICNAIDENDSKTQSKPTSQIIYSDRFRTIPEMSREAAQRGKLPVFKVYGEPGHEALKASVKFIEKLIEREAQFGQQNAELRNRELELEKRVAELEGMLGRAAATAPSVTTTVSATATSEAISTVEQYLEASSKNDLRVLLDELSKLSSQNAEAKALEDEGNQLMHESGRGFWDKAKKYGPRVLAFLQTVPLPPPAGPVVALANRFVQAVSGNTTS